ncbi:TolC family protein [Aquabacterium sp. J223]|uniref:TolC family protein n=1 Tax=Aquabacterium sp. J223 TaxID=2898431 RepID=UPI0021AD54E1|nr:TolC family protein [Aquabacterium sp. J223]UUX97220.1 TolC family protein [Aquabacterium sp. J223]
MRLVLVPVLLWCCASAMAQACPPLSADEAGRLTAAQVVQRVPACHPDVLAARRALDASAADVQVAGQRPNPQLTLGAASVGRDLGRSSLWNKPFDHQVRIDQLIERGRKPALRVAGAEAQREAVRADVAEVGRLALLATLGLYHDWVAATARRDGLEAAAKLVEESQQALDRRVRAGDAAPLDASRFRVDALRVQADRVQAEADLRRLRQPLALALGAPEQADRLAPAAMADGPDGEPPTPAPLAQRPAVVAARARLEAARRSRELALAQRTRDVAVGLQADRYPTTPTNNSGNGNTVSVFVSVPLFLRHAYEGDIARGEADVAAAEQALQRTQVEAADEAVRAQLAWQAASQRRRLVLDELLPAAERVAAGAELAYRRGASGVLEVLDARRNLRAAQQERVGAEAEAAKAWAALQALTVTAPPPVTATDPMTGAAPSPAPAR